ncbi:NAD(P)-binding protein [Pseudovirgaria hyperparasitica]|uniref:NAD(P)-binding protein n=1 Tax=Pseudovirgaria hyperparasitica TaxID=470096 RepID=A0A6A6WLV3_9PEZI|nr:NAD(P)-binding protein [Pseudovirgaria hyperparasitica]KAF2763184.1 NAD(P)-binding protein [Pseudovirgaria hyperparasitica]
MSYTKKAVHFGGGAIGRGFVAEFLHNSGYEVTFVDVDRKLVDNLNKIPSYVITEIGDDGERQFTIDHYKALHGIDDFATVVKAIAEADVVTCAVGPTILPRISKPVAEAIAVRELDYPLAVIACENAINATDNWRGFIEGHVKAEYLKDGKIPSDSSKARFANSAVDRIVPKQPEGFVLDVKIEKFYEWCVEEVPFENGGKKPEIKGVHFVKDLQPYIERKLFTVNTSHATAAYYGYNAGIGLIHEVLADKKIHDTIRAVVKETAHLISNKHKIDTKEQNDYVEAIIKAVY